MWYWPTNSSRLIRPNQAKNEECLERKPEQKFRKNTKPTIWKDNVSVVITNDWYSIKRSLRGTRQCKDERRHISSHWRTSERRWSSRKLHRRPIKVPPTWSTIFDSNTRDSRGISTLSPPICHLPFLWSSFPHKSVDFEPRPKRIQRLLHRKCYGRVAVTTKSGHKSCTQYLYRSIFQRSHHPEMSSSELTKRAFQGRVTKSFSKKTCQQDKILRRKINKIHFYLWCRHNGDCKYRYRYFNDEPQSRQWFLVGRFQSDLCENVILRLLFKALQTLGWSNEHQSENEKPER